MIDNNCPICRGWGFETYWNPEANQEWARPCSCRTVNAAKRRIEQSGISKAFRNKGFKNFKVDDNPTLKRAKNIALDYCKRFPELRETSHNSILLLGQVGCGKTHLSMSCANAIMDTYQTGVIYFAYREEVLRLKQYTMQPEEYEKRISHFKESPVLLIDDLMKGRNSEADVNVLFEIINYRYLNQLPMIVSSEKSIKELLAFDEGVMSRLVEMARGHIIEMQGAELNHRLV